MTEYDNNNSGVLFKNDRKEKDTHPDYTGNCEIQHVQYWISAWIKQGKSGQKFFSFSFRPKDEQQPAGDVPSALPPSDDIPF